MHVLHLAWQGTILCLQMRCVQRLPHCKDPGLGSPFGQMQDQLGQANYEKS